MRCPTSAGPRSCGCCPSRSSCWCVFTLVCLYWFRGAKTTHVIRGRDAVLYRRTQASPRQRGRIPERVQDPGQGAGAGPHPHLAGHGAGGTGEPGQGLGGLDAHHRHLHVGGRLRRPRRQTLYRGRPASRSCLSRTALAEAGKESALKSILSRPESPAWTGSSRPVRALGLALALLSAAATGRVAIGRPGGSGGVDQGSGKGGEALPPYWWMWASRRSWAPCSRWTPSWWTKGPRR